MVRNPLSALDMEARLSFLDPCLVLPALNGNGFGRNPFVDDPSVREQAILHFTDITGFIQNGGKPTAFSTGVIQNRGNHRLASP